MRGIPKLTVRFKRLFNGETRNAGHGPEAGAGARGAGNRDDGEHVTI